MSEQKAKKPASIDELERTIREYRWLQGIANNYSKCIALMDKEESSFRVHGILYCARNDGAKMDINPHRSIPVKYLRAGLQEALDGVLREIAEMEEKINK